MLPIPSTLFLAICGAIGLIIYYIQSKKKNKFAKIFLVLGIILILMAIIPWILLSLQSL